MRIVTFRQIGFFALDHTQLNALQVRVLLIDLACHYLMDNDYAEFNECDVIASYDNIVICWLTGTVSVPVRPVYKPGYLQ